MRAFSVGDVVRLEVQGTTLRMYRNGVQVSTNITDSGAGSLSSGKFGMYAQEITAADALQFDNFVGGDFTTATKQKRPIVFQ